MLKQLSKLIPVLILTLGLVVALILIQKPQLLQKKAFVETSNTLSFIHQDNLGSVALVTDRDGNVVSRNTYYPYGATRSSEGLSPTDKGYTGQVSDIDQTGLLFYNARYYDPAIAKFTQADKAGDTLNKYAYVGNNPINDTDPSGNMVEPPMADFGEGSGGGRSIGWGSTNKLSIFPVFSANTGTGEWTNPISDSGIVGAQTIPMWNGSSGEEYPYSSMNGDPNAFYILLGSVAVFSTIVPLTVACVANPVCVAGVIAVVRFLGPVDAAVDMAQCAGGDRFACMLMFEQSFSASLIDDIVNMADSMAPRGSLAYMETVAEIIYEGFPKYPLGRLAGEAGDLSDVGLGPTLVHDVSLGKAPIVTTTLKHAGMDAHDYVYYPDGIDSGFATTLVNHEGSWWVVDANTPNRVEVFADFAQRIKFSSTPPVFDPVTQYGHFLQPAYSKYIYR